VSWRIAGGDVGIAGGAVAGELQLELFCPRGDEGVLV